MCCTRLENVCLLIVVPSYKNKTTPVHVCGIAALSTLVELSCNIRQLINRCGTVSGKKTVIFF